MNSGILFPGYGNQFVGMGKELYDAERLMQEYFEEAATCLNVNFVKLCFASSEIELGKITNAYPALFLVEAASAGLLKERGVHAKKVAGVDLVSWYSALHAAESVTLPDGLYILNKIALLYDELISKDGYAAIKVQGATKPLKALCKKVSQDQAQVAVSHAYQDSCIVTGTIEGIKALEDILKGKPEYAYKDVDVYGGLHTSLAEALSVQVNDYLEKIDFKEPVIPVVSPLTGSVVTTAEELRHIARTILVQPLDIAAVFKTVISDLDRLIITVPSVHMSAYVESLAAGISVVTMETAAEFAAITADEPQETKEENVTND